MNGYEQQLEQKKNRVLVENNAQFIFDHLMDKANIGGKHERRWLWELLQNAKDSIDESKAISVEVEFQDTQLIFRHNGNPFTDDEIIHLIYHGSTKKGLADKTGKFGTGFLMTHLLSKKVLVSGILGDERHFRFILDRSGKSPKEVENAMESSWEEFKNLHIESLHNKFTTIFQYELDNEGRRIAENGLRDLRRILPFVLAFNPKFESIVLKISGGFESFSKISVKEVDQDRIKIVTIESRDQEQNSVLHTLAIASEDKTTTAVPCLVTDEVTIVKHLEDDIPKLFYDFPLFGTEDFSFPAVINSSSFEPTPERDGIYLGKNESEEISHNRQIIEQARGLYLELVQFACDARWRNLYELASFSQPISKEWLDISWYKRMFQNMLDEVLCKEIVETENTMQISPKHAIFPIDSPLFDLWELSSSIYSSKLPIKKHAEIWMRILKSWGELLGRNPDDFDFCLTFQKFCKILSGFATLEKLEAALQTLDERGCIPWLNKFFHLLLLQNKKHLFEEYPIIPNQNGVFRKKTTMLFLDCGIDESIKDVAKASGDDLRDHLVHRAVELDNSLLAKKNQEEVLRSTLSSLKEKTVKNSQNSPLRKPIIDIFSWLVKHQRSDLLREFPVVTSKAELDSAASFSILSTTTRMLVPPELWQKTSMDFSELFSPEFILATEYTMNLSKVDWDYLIENLFVYSDPIFQEDTILDNKFIFSDDTEQKEHRLESVKCSRIAYLELNDKGVIDRIRKSKPRALLFFKFLLSHVLVEDSNWLQSMTVNCECGSTHLIVPSHWFHYIKTRRWVPSGNSRTEFLSAQSLAGLLENEWDSISKLKEDKPALFLNKTEIGVGELLRNIVTGDDDIKKLEWDKAIAAILTSGSDPNRLMTEFEKREKDREKVRTNQHLGKTIEAIFEATFKSDELKALGFTIRRTGLGHDYEIEHDFVQDEQEQLLSLQTSTKSILVEIKATTGTSVAMTCTQGTKAVQEQNRFCLCVVPISSIEITDEIIKTSARFVMNIGELLKPEVSAVLSFHANRMETISSGGGIQIDISEPLVKYRINQAVWENGKSFNEFIESFLDSPYEKRI